MEQLGKYGYISKSNMKSELAEEKDNLMKAIRLLGCMSEEKIDVTQYRSILEAIFTENNNILSSLDSPNRSNLHRMIRIYDFLEYGQKKTP